MCCKTKQKNRLKCPTIKTNINSLNFFSESFFGAGWHTSDSVVKAEIQIPLTSLGCNKGISLDCASCYPRWREGLVVNQGKHTYTPTIPISLSFISLFSGLQKKLCARSKIISGKKFNVFGTLNTLTFNMATAGFFTFENSMFDEKNKDNLTGPRCP